MMHKLLSRQLARFLGEKYTVPSSEWQEFLEAVDETYKSNDADRALLEHSLELSSQEMLGINKDLEKKVQERTKELTASMNKLQKSYDLMVGREIKMTEMKKEMKDLQQKLQSLENPRASM